LSPVVRASPVSTAMRLHWHHSSYTPPPLSANPRPTVSARPSFTLDRILAPTSDVTATTASRACQEGPGLDVTAFSGGALLVETDSSYYKTPPARSASATSHFGDGGEERTTVGFLVGAAGERLSHPNASVCSPPVTP
ncbi:hypothetical protein HK405_003785, partial [Cladochytrium tenue]